MLSRRLSHFKRLRFIPPKGLDDAVRQEDVIPCPVSRKERQAPHQLQDLHPIGQSKLFHSVIGQTVVMLQRVPPVQELGQPPAGHAFGVMPQPEIVNGIKRNPHFLLAPHFIVISPIAGCSLCVCSMPFNSASFSAAQSGRN